jgi:hypothetical protein
MEKLLVSIMIPTDNSASTIERCLKSVVEQNYENYRVVILDNRSNDGTYDILTDFEKHYRDLVYIGRLHDRVCPVDHRHRCWDMANPRTRVLQFLQPTSVLSPQYLNRTMEMMESDKRIGCVLTHAEIIHPDGRISSAPRFRPKSGIIPGDEQMEAFMAQGFELRALPIYRAEAYHLSCSEGFIFNRFPDWLPLLMTSTIYDLGYIRESQAYCGDDRAILGEEFIPSLEDQFEHYLFLQAFHTIAARLGRHQVCEQLPVAIRRLALEGAKAAMNLGAKGDLAGARAFLSLAQAYLPEIGQDPSFQQISETLESPERAQQ